MTPLTAVLCEGLFAGLCAGLGLLALPGARVPRAPAAAPGAPGHRPWLFRRSGRPGSGQHARLDAPLLLDLVAAVVEAGAPPASAVMAVARVLSEVKPGAGEQLAQVAEELADPGPRPAPGARASRPARSAPSAEAAVIAELLVPLRRCLTLAEQTGAPVAALLRSSGDELRRRRRRRSALAAARLGVRVVAPLGLCTLPAFALLGVVPVLLSLGRGLLG